VLGGGGAGFFGTGFGRFEPLEFGKLVSYKRCFGWEDAQLRAFHHTCVRSPDCWAWTHSGSQRGFPDLQVFGICRSDSPQPGRRYFGSLAILRW